MCLFRLWPHCCHFLLLQVADASAAGAEGSAGALYELDASAAGVQVVLFLSLWALSIGSFCAELLEGWQQLPQTGKMSRCRS